MSAGILLDGTWHARVSCGARRRGRRAFAWALPRHLLYRQVDVIDLKNGTSLLGAPWNAVEAYGIAFGAVTVSDGLIQGAFRAAPWLAGDLPVEFMAGDAVAARGFAHRGDSPEWRFALRPLSLLLPHSRLMVRPRVGGLADDAPEITIEAHALGVVGVLESASPHHAEGWALGLADASARIAVDIVIDGAVVDCVLADRPGEAALTRGAGDAHCSFAVALPEAADPFATRVLGVRLAGTGTHLAGSPVAFSPAPGVVGRLDALKGVTAHGWAFDRSAPAAPARVELVGPDGEVIAQAVAENYRPDLLKAGLGDGFCSFEMNFADRFASLAGREVSVRVAGTAIVLPGSPMRVGAPQ